MAVRKEKRKNGFRYVLDYYDQNGKRHYQAMPKGATKKEAEAAEAEIISAISRGVYIPSKKIPVFREVCKEWLAYRQPTLRASSFRTYEIYIGKHFTAFDSLKVNMLTTARLESFISDKQKEGMPIKTVRYIRGLLNQILSYAVRHRYIERNPLSDTERLRGSSEQKGSFLMPDEINRLLNTEGDPMYNTLFKLAVFSGARQGELLGLRWCDVSFNDKQIRIERSFNHGAVYEPKNRTSRRKIDLGDDVMLMLREYRKTNLHNDLVFCDKKGKHLQGETVRKHFRKALKKADLPVIRFHDLRHTFASLLIHQGENIKVIQTQLGHSTPTQTLNTYSHLMKNPDSDIAGRLEKAVLKACS